MKWVIYNQVHSTGFLGFRFPSFQILENQWKPVETWKLFCLFTDECARANVVTHCLLQHVLFVASSHHDARLFSLSARQKIMELTPINPTISSSASAASSSGQGTHKILLLTIPCCLQRECGQRNPPSPKRRRET